MKYKLLSTLLYLLYLTACVPVGVEEPVAGHPIVGFFTLDGDILSECNMGDIKGVYGLITDSNDTYHGVFSATYENVDCTGPSDVVMWSHGWYTYSDQSGGVYLIELEGGRTKELGVNGVYTIDSGYVTVGESFIEQDGLSYTHVMFDEGSTFTIIE